MNTNAGSASTPIGDDKPRRRISGCLKVIGLLILLVVVSPYITQFGYCRGWWLTANHWAYYWWLCDCGPEFEQSLQPENVEIVVSACLLPREAALSPDGRYMFVATRSNARSYLIDFVIGERISWLYDFSLVDEAEFWTDTLATAYNTNPQPALVDVTDGSIIKLIPVSTYKEGIKLTEILQIFQEGKRVVMVDGTHGDVVLVLDPNPKQNGARNYALVYSKDEQEQLQAVLTANGIAYQTIKLCSAYEGICPSHDGRFVATSRQIWTSDKKLLAAIEGNPTFNDGIMLVGWAHDDSGAYLQFNPHSHIVDGGFITVPRYRLPQPIFKLRVPAEYGPAVSPD